MSRAANGDFGGKCRNPDRSVGFEVYPADGGGYIATGAEPNFDGEGRGPTAALAIADYCQRYHDATTGEVSSQ